MYLDDEEISLSKGTVVIAPEGSKGVSREWKDWLQSLFTLAEGIEMGEFNLEEVTKFSAKNVVSTTLYDSQKVCANFLCMEEGQRHWKILKSKGNSHN